MHDLVVGNGWLSAAEFWFDLTPGQIWWVIRSRVPEKVVRDRETDARLFRKLKEARAREAQETAKGAA